MSEDEYVSSSAMWESALAQGRARAREHGVDAQGLQRRLVYSRFLARVFANPDSPWVLKGGTVALMQVPAGRSRFSGDQAGPRPCHRGGSPRRPAACHHQREHGPAGGAAGDAAR